MSRGVRFKDGERVMAKFAGEYHEADVLFYLGEGTCKCICFKHFKHFSMISLKIRVNR